MLKNWDGKCETVKFIYFAIYSYFEIIILSWAQEKKNIPLCFNIFVVIPGRQMNYSRRWNEQLWREKIFAFYFAFSKKKYIERQRSFMWGLSFVRLISLHRGANLRMENIEQISSYFQTCILKCTNLKRSLLRKTKWHLRLVTRICRLERKCWIIFKNIIYKIEAACKFQLVPSKMWVEWRFLIRIYSIRINVSS